MILLQRNYQNDSLLVNPTSGMPNILAYEDYVNLARIPYCDGIAKKVVQSLQMRVGQTELNVERIADDLGITKRTLQRRLQQLNTSFVQLRDDIRFHYAVKFLVEDKMSVDVVSKALDFSDRTSFTNAFKRWTGISPSLFRKLFRDCV